MGHVVWHVVCEVRFEPPFPLASPHSVAPEITGDLTFSKDNPEEGEATTATCTWSGDPAPTVQWFKDGKLLVESELPSHMRISLFFSGMGSKLEILEAELGDTGNYRCNVSNPVGRDSRVRRLEVRGDVHVHHSDVAVQECYLHGSNYMYIAVTYHTILFLPSWYASLSMQKAPPQHLPQVNDVSYMYKCIFYHSLYS